MEEDTYTYVGLLDRVDMVEDIDTYVGWLNVDRCIEQVDGLLGKDSYVSWALVGRFIGYSRDGGGQIYICMLVD